MAKKGSVRVSRSDRDSFFLPVLILVLMIAILSGVFAFFWQSRQTQKGEELLYWPSRQEEPGVSSESSAPPAPESSSEPAAPESSSPEASSETPSEAPSSSEPEAPVPVRFEGALPKTERVTTSYFDDALFVGDSITTGIELYGIMDNANVVASTGINLDNIRTKKAIDVKGGGQVTVLEAMSQYDPAKIYVMLGANGLAFLGPEKTVELYSEFVDHIREQHPDAILYIQSILPIHEEKFSRNYKGELKNTDIDRCNELLMEMAQEKEMIYLDVAEAFRNESGGLDEEATTDGLHFKSAYYTKWMDYLKTHAIQ